MCEVRRAWNHHLARNETTLPNDNNVQSTLLNCQTLLIKFETYFTASRTTWIIPFGMFYETFFSNV